MVERNEKLNDFLMNNIVNVGKAGLSYKLLSRKTYICDFVNRKSFRQTKEVNAKDRVTP